MTRASRITLAAVVVCFLANGRGVAADESIRGLVIDMPAQPDGDGGLAVLSPEQVRDLRQAREALKAVIVDPVTPDNVLVEAVPALERVHIALADWGREGQLEWYLQAWANCEDRRAKPQLLEGALSAARGRQHHLVYLQQFWTRIRPRLADNEEGDLPRAYRRYRDGFRLSSGLRFRRGVRETFSPDLSVLSIEPRQVDLSGERRLEPMRLRIAGLEMDRHLQPLPEPEADAD